MYILILVFYYMCLIHDERLKPRIVFLISLAVYDIFMLTFVCIHQTDFFAYQSNVLSRYTLMSHVNDIKICFLKTLGSMNVEHAYVADVSEIFCLVYARKS